MDFVLNKFDKQLDNHRSLDQHINDLKRKVMELNGVKEDTDSRMNAELQPRKKLKSEVQIWLENVKRINGEVQNLNERISESSTLTRGFHADDVLKRTREVEELIQQGKFQDGLVVDDHQWIGQVLPTTTLSGEGAKASVEEIWQCLMDDKVRKIGVWGMGGVGKTSIMKLINNQLLKETGKFHSVIWITVSKDKGIAKLQKDLASKIGVSVCDDDDEITRSGMLFEKLSRKSRFVMILDDIWEELSLEKVGIPEPSTGSKLVLTTRSFDVCRKMSCRAIKVKPLVEEESWKLFSEKVGQGIVNIPQVEPIAKKIAEHCAGLPLGVITVASSMKDIDDLSEWKNALKELSARKKSVNGWEEEVFQQLRFSYDRLKDPKLQHCFLSCALYPEDCRIGERELVKLWIAEGLVEEMDSWQAEFARGRAIMNKLLNNCLLEVADGFGWSIQRRVKMHDLVRYMALSITTVKPRFLVKAGMGLFGPPNVQEWSEDLEKVSLMMNWDLEVLYPLEMSLPKFPMLTTLDLTFCGIMSIPEGLFNHMDGLKILNLSWNPIKSLPICLSNLKNLTALLLACCGRLEYVPSLSNLRVLKVLNLKRTKIKEVPHGLQNLSSLKYLNLKRSSVKKIPNGKLSRLSCLQYLKLGRTLISGKEACKLKKLEFFEGRFNDLHNLNMYAQAFHGREEPHKFRIFVGREGLTVKYFTFRRIELTECNINPDQIMLPPHIEELGVLNCACCCDEGPIFPTIFHRSVLNTSFGTISSLKYLSIWNLENMKRLFFPNCVPRNLEVLRIFHCTQLEEIITSEEERGRVTMEFCLPRLRKIELMNLPELKSICSVDAVVFCESFKAITVLGCPKLKRMPLNIPQLHSSPILPLNIETQKEWWESVEWDAKLLQEGLVNSGMLIFKPFSLGDEHSSSE